MISKNQVNIDLRRWTPDDLALLQRLTGDPAMMEHTGGPETPEKIQKRLQMYCRDSQTSNIHMFVIVLQPENNGIGSVGFWEREWYGERVWESGWRILPEHQGQGIASRAIGLILERARAEDRHRFVHAFPSTENAASNALCRKLGFTLRGEVDFEFPPGHWTRSNDWRFGLFQNDRGQG
jgi:RimJ/RimL family protein N-acetyltransferase